MSRKAKKGKKKYSVDDILSEYDKNDTADGEDTLPGELPAEEKTSENGGNNNTESNIDTDVDSGYKYVPEEEDDEAEKFAPAEAFSVDDTAEAAEKLFGGEARDGRPPREGISDLSELLDDDSVEKWSESNESAAQITDEGAFKEELEEDEVPEEEKTDASLKPSESDEAETIEADEDTEENTESIENTENTDSKGIKTGSGSADKINPEAEDSSVNDDAEKENTAEKPDTSVQEVPEAEKEKKSFRQGIIPCKGDSLFEIFRKIVFIAAVTVFIGAGVMLASTLIQSRKALQDAKDIKDFVTTTAATSIGEDGSIITIAPTEEEREQHNIDVLAKYKAISKNVMGFIELEGCDIYYPVVQGEDNEYYLTRTYYDETNKGGAIYADWRCVFSEDYTSPNVVIYGHNQEDGTMFGNLKNYKQNLEFYAANPVVTFNTEYGLGTYLIYGFFVTNALEKQDSNGEVFHYHDYIETMNDEYTFNWYLKEVQKRNQIISPVDVEFGDKLLCLSTCSDEFSNSRFVVFARKLRDGESVSDYDFSETRFNPYAKGVDWTAILSGETSATEEPEETTRKKKTNLAQTSADEDETEETTKKKKKKTTAETAEEAPADDDRAEPAVTEVPETAAETPATETGGVSG